MRLTNPLTPLLTLTLTPFLTHALSITDLGHWDVNITKIGSASGNAAQLTWAIYSNNPAKTIYEEWRFDPSSGSTTTSNNERTFSLSIDGFCGLGHDVVSIKQTVDDGTRTYWIAGSANVTFTVNPVTGRGGTASFRVDAALDDTAKDVCGRPRNQEPS